MLKAKSSYNGVLTEGKVEGSIENCFPFVLSFILLWMINSGSMHGKIDKKNYYNIGISLQVFTGWINIRKQWSP